MNLSGNEPKKNSTSEENELPSLGSTEEPPLSGSWLLRNEPPRPFDSFEPVEVTDSNEAFRVTAGGGAGVDIVALIEVAMRRK